MNGKKGKDSASDNKYGALLVDDDDDAVDDGTEDRKVDTGDFNQTGDTLVTPFMNDSVRKLASSHEDFTEEKFDRLVFEVIKVVVKAEPEYNTKSKLPEWFKKRKPQRGLGLILIDFFTPTDTNDIGSIDTMIALIKNIKASDARRWENLRNSILTVQEQNTQSRTHKKDAEGKNKKKTAVVATSILKRSTTTPSTNGTNKKQSTLTFTPSVSKALSKVVEEEEDTIMS